MSKRFKDINCILHNHIAVITLAGKSANQCESGELAWYWWSTARVRAFIRWSQRPDKTDGWK